MKRIAFVTCQEGVAVAGSEMMWLESASSLLDQGASVSFSTPDWRPIPDAHRRLVEKGALPIPYVPSRSNHPIVRRLKRWHSRIPGTYLATVEKIAAWKPDFVFISQTNNIDGVWWMEEFLKRGIPYVTFATAAGEGSWPPDAEVPRIRRALEGASANYYVAERNRILTSQQIAMEVPRSRVLRNPHGIPYDLSWHWPSMAGGLKFAFPARFNFRAKGQNLVLEALSQRKWKDRDFQINFIGSGEWENAIRELIRFYGISQASIRKDVKEMRSIWEEHHALFLTSYVEGTPIVVAQALLCGRPCLVTDIAGNAELMEDGKSGFVAQSPCVAAVDEAMERLWSARNDLEEMGKRAQQKARIMIPEDPAAVWARSIMETGTL